MLPNNLDAVSIRVLGALIEKDLSTPDNYPLSLHALVSACNQTSNRDPVMTLDEAAVSRALDTLRHARLTVSFQGIGSRVPKFRHLLEEGGDLSRTDLAVIGVLALRGPQTLSEIRTRASRLTPSNDANAIESALEALIAREPSTVVARLARRPGQKEVRFAQLLGGEVTFEGVDSTPASTTAAPDRIAMLEERVQELTNEVADVRAQLEAFRKQFE